MGHTFLTNKLKEDFLVAKLSGWKRIVFEFIALSLPILAAIQATAHFAFNNTLMFIPFFIALVFCSGLMIYSYKKKREYKEEWKLINEDTVSEWLRNMGISTIDELQFFLDEVKATKTDYWKFRDTFLGHMYFIFAPLLIAPISSFLGLFYADGVPATDARYITIIFLWLYIVVLTPIYINAFMNNDLFDRIRISNNRIDKIEQLVKHELHRKLEREKKKTKRLADLKSKYRKYR